MRPINTLAVVALASLIAIASPVASAHRDEDHTKPAGPVRMEQVPWGIAGDAKAAKRSIDVSMSDQMRFTPDRIEVRQGETVRIVVRNQGKLRHEFVMGMKVELDAHAALMAKFPDMEHDEPYMAHVAPGKTGEIVWTFNRAGEFDFACLMAGHYQAGMVGKIRVLASTASTAAAPEMVDGEVRKVDKEASKITLRHGEIKSLDMPPMTMVFVVRDKVLLDGLLPGDKLRFRAINDAGKLTVTEIQTTK